MIYRKLLLQVKYLLGKKKRPKTCKRCGVKTLYSEKGDISYFTPCGVKPCTDCSEYVAVVDERKISRGYMN